MRSVVIAGLYLGVLSISVMPALAQESDPNQCTMCHEPSEDWAGMTVEEIMADARDPENKRLKDMDSLSDDQLRLIIERALPE